MKAKSLFLLALAAGCGLIASIGVSQVMDGKRGQVPTEETEEILVAATDVDINKKLDAQNTRLEAWPKSRIPQNAIRTFEEAKDKFTAARLFPGEAILVGKLLDDQNTVRIPEGFRAIPIKIESDTVLGLIQPGDQVDVMVFVRQQEGVPNSGAFTILQNVRVFTVNNTASRDVQGDEKAGERSLKTVSLLLKPNQTERLTLAAEVGKVRLTLRRPTDEVLDDKELNERLPPLFQDADHTARDDKKKEPESTVSVPVPNPVAPAVPLVSQPATPVTLWKMQVHSPADVRQFEWDSEEGLPHETSPHAPRVMSPGSPVPPAGAAFAPPVPKP